MSTDHAAPPVPASMPEGAAARVFTIAEARKAQRPDVPRCSQCGRTATTVHLFSGARPAQLACEDHDPEGYWIDLYKTTAARRRGVPLDCDIEGWLAHLTHSHPLVAADLLRWMATPEGLAWLYFQARPRMTGRPRP